MPSASARAAPVPTERGAEPTAEEAAQAPVPRFVPIVPNPSMTSRLPCPPGATLSVLDRSLECNAARSKNALPSREGPSLRFHANGKLASQGQYAGGQSTGHWWFFRDDGTLDHEVDCAFGEWDGVYVAYWPSGLRREEHHEKAGKHEGPAKTWDAHGKLRSWSLYEDDRLVRAKFFR